MIITKKIKIVIDRIINMSTEKSPQESKSNQCFVCNKSVADKKIIECNDCCENFCKDHIKVDELTHSSICYPCFKSKIHLEVSMEMQNQMTEAKTSLNTLKDKLKNCKKDLSNKKAAVERYESQVKINEKGYLRKFENLEKKIEEESKRTNGIIIASESLKTALTDCKANEKSAESKLEIINKEFIEVKTELDTIREENNKLKLKINENNLKMKKYVSYSLMRNVMCENCKKKVKSLYKEEILKANKGRESLIQSVLNERDKISSRKTMSQINIDKDKPDESCKCLIC